MIIAYFATSMVADYCFSLIIVTIAALPLHILPGRRAPDPSLVRTSVLNTIRNLGYDATTGGVPSGTCRVGGGEIEGVCVCESKHLFAGFGCELLGANSPVPEARQRVY